ncbi:cytochrome P450 [Kitasatospora sp. NPDC057965]|uniref:cytochrome P450 n=1 Tax=Kitasatospora sp. NPDC057965 TaxID=3346291 RepID=UPI0036DC4BDF
MMDRSRVLDAPGALPLLGHAWELWRRPLAFLSSLAGTCDVAVLRLGPQRAHLLVSPEAVWEVLVTRNHDFNKGALFERGRAVTGNSIVASEGDFHKRQRRLLRPAFSVSRFGAYTELVRDVAQDMSARWHAGRTIAVDQEMFRISAAAVTVCLFSAPGVAEEAAAVAMRSMPTVATGVAMRALFPSQLPFRLPLPTNRRYERSLRDMHAVIDRIIADYRATGVRHGDLLSMLLDARDEESGERMTDAQIHDECAGLLAVGSETTARTLAWLFHVLGSLPQVAGKVQAELDDVLGDGPVTYEAITRLDYLPRLVHEVLRFHSPAFLFTRSPHADLDLGGHRVPAGTLMLWSPYVLHHNPAFFPAPERFDPDRWIEPTVEARRAFLPFGAGPHRCIGSAFAVNEIITILATVTRHWHLTPAGTGPVRSTALAIHFPTRLPMLPVPVTAAR